MTNHSHVGRCAEALRVWMVARNTERGA